MTIDRYRAEAEDAAAEAGRVAASTRRAVNATAEAPTTATRVRAWLTKPVQLPAPDLDRVVGWAAFASVFVLAAALWATFGPLAGAAGLAPLLIWHAARSRQQAVREAHERVLAVTSATTARTLTRPAAPTRTLDEGGEVKPAPWSPTSYGGE